MQLLHRPDFPTAKEFTRYVEDSIEKFSEEEFSAIEPEYREAKKNESKQYSKQGVESHSELLMFSEPKELEALEDEEEKKAEQNASKDEQRTIYRVQWPTDRLCCGSNGAYLFGQLFVTDGESPVALNFPA